MKIVNLLFLAFFVIYAASPLTCTLETARKTGNKLNETIQVQYCLYLVDLFLSGFDDDNGNTDGQTETDDDHLLVRKKSSPVIH